MTDVYTWSAIYNDDTSLDEYEAYNFASVDQSRVKCLMLFSPEHGLPIHSVVIPESAEAVFFRRRTIELGPTNNNEGNRSTTHCIGWKNGESAVYLFVFNDGSTLLTTDLQAV